MRLRSAKVLIVANEDVSTSLATLMNVEGIKTLQTDDWKAGLVMVSAESPDVMLLETSMPSVEELEVIRWAKLLDPNLKVILITPHFDRRSAMRALKAGAYDFLEKPFPIQEAIRVVRSALSKRKSKRQQRDPGLSEHDTPFRKAAEPVDSLNCSIGEASGVTDSDLSLIIIGETGSSDEFVTRGTSQARWRSKYPLTSRVNGVFWKGLSLKEILKQGTILIEREVISQVLKATRGNEAEAARLLQVGHEVLHEKIMRLEQEQFNNDDGGKDGQESREETERTKGGEGPLRTVSLIVQRN